MAAGFIIFAYQIKYNIDGGSNSSNNPDTYNIHDTKYYPIKLYEPTKTEYKFEGWYDNESFNGDIISEIAKGEIGDRNKAMSSAEI